MCKRKEEFMKKDKGGGGIYKRGKKYVPKSKESGEGITLVGKLIANRER